MRSSVLLSAFCAASVLGTPADKRDYVTDVNLVTVTDWTVVTVTETVTAHNAPAPSTSSTVENTPSPEPAPESTPADTPADIPPQTESSASTTTHDLPPVPTITPKSENNPPKNNPDNGGVVWTTAWTEAWTSVWTNEPAAPTHTQPPSAPAANPYQHTVLHNHNVHRSNHSAGEMTWSPSLEATAHKLASQCVYKHDTSMDGGGYGQNIGYGIEANNIGVMISDLMYNGEFGYFQPFFGQANPDMSDFDLWGHFTQIVWKGSKEVGCATVVCNNLGNVDASEPMPFTVCNYSPAGNYKGEYGKNVGTPQGQPIFTA